jgi:hypothetical protein
MHTVRRKGEAVRLNYHSLAITLAAVVVGVAIGIGLTFGVNWIESFWR